MTILSQAIRDLPHFGANPLIRPQLALAAILQPANGMRPLLTKYARYGVTAAWVIAGVWLLGATAGELRAAWLVLPTPPEVSQDVMIRNAKDDEGKNASFRILLFSDEFRWRINSFDAIEKDGKRPQFTAR